VPFDTLHAVVASEPLRKLSQPSSACSTRGAHTDNLQPFSLPPLWLASRSWDAIIRIWNIAMLQLRPYQEAAKEAVYHHLRTRDDNPCVAIPTAGGKTPVIASICKDAVNRWNGRVLILAHVKELLQQTADKLTEVCPEVRFGVYSAGLKRRDTAQPVIVASIQSVYRRASDFRAFDLALIDEAHLIPLEGDGMYRQFLGAARAVNPHLPIIGFTATPFRMKTGPICTPQGFLNAICYEIGVRELIRDGYLCPLVTKAGKAKVDTCSLHVRGGEFVPDEVEKLMDQDALVQAACAEIIDHTRDRHACIIFASGIAHGQHIVAVLGQTHGVECGFVCGETPNAQRSELLNRFRYGDLKYLCNVNVLTTGFDAPNIDCVALLRPTLSPGLYYQMVGRGFRLCPGKASCLVLDFGGNVQRHGPVDQVKPEAHQNGNGTAPAKECPACNAVIAAGYARCPDCRHEFPPRERRGCEAEASEAQILSAELTTTRHTVQQVFYSVHTKRGAGENAPKTLRVDYKIGLHHYKSEWICLEHGGYARQKAVAWWKRRSCDPVPDTAKQAVEIAHRGGLADTMSITVRSITGDPFERVIDYELGPLPEPISAGTVIDCHLNPIRF
jgi:DNA repair protein RadD